MVEPGDVQGRDFIEWFGAILLLLLTVGGQAWQYIRESKKDEPPKHVVIETAELADMGPVRDILLRLDRLLDLETDIAETKRATVEMHSILERMDRQAETRALLREEMRREARRDPG
ncbi:MAG TPA: hypothetical protein VH414_18375 [Lichenihabitans sp.]|jgi:hypothetical protein|nr:hypothetical protein [Lichenihabitans sp.]